jgi:hypothetical protein
VKSWIKAHLKQIGPVFFVIMVALISIYMPRPQTSQKIGTPKQEVKQDTKSPPSVVKIEVEKKPDPQPKPVSPGASAPAWYKQPKWIISISVTTILFLAIFLPILSLRRKIKRVEYVELEEAEPEETEEDVSSVDKKPKRVRYWYKPWTWHPDAPRVFYSILALAIINTIVWGMTINRVPEIWRWYTEHLLFALAFNAGIVAAIFYYYQKDDNGKYISDMQKRATLILWVIGILLIVNLVMDGFKSTKTLTGLSPEERAQNNAGISALANLLKPAVATSRQIETIVAPVEEWSEWYYVGGFKIRLDEDGRKYREEIVYWLIDEETKEKHYFSQMHDVGERGQPKIIIPGIIEKVRVQSRESEPVIVRIILTPK